MSLERTALRCAIAGILGAGTLSCSGEPGPGESTETSMQAVVGEDEHLYFRCNATSWDVNADSRLQPTSDPYTFTLTYEVTEPWMISGGDSCTLTLTNQQDGWGTQQSFFGLRDGFSPLLVPDSAPVSATTTTLAVHYPETGEYTVSVNWRSGTLAIAPAGPTPEEAAAENASAFYDYLEDRFGWLGVDGAGAEAPIVFTTTPRNNAQWTGASLVIGEADGVRTRSFAFSRDMIAHELVHAVNTNSAELQPAGETGAINESFADVLAVFSTAENDVVDWHVGEEVWTPQIDGDALRNLEDPHVGFHRETLQSCQFDPELPFICGQSKHLSEYVNVPGAGGEHVNLGILNRAAYLLVEGGSQGGISVDGIGVRKAEQIYFRALTQHLPGWATFSDVRHLLGVACAELVGQHGISATDCDSVDDAFAAVGIDAPDLNAPAGISGRVTAGGLPAQVTLVLAVSGKSSPAIGNVDILETTTDANGDFVFTVEDIATELAPPRPQVDVVFQVRYRNTTDPTRLAEWDSSWFDESTYAEGTTIPTFDVAGLPSMSSSGVPTALPMTFTWSPRTGDLEYYRWVGQTGNGAGMREQPSRIHPTPQLVVTESVAANLAGGSAFPDLAEWAVGIRNYAGTGITGFVPLD